MRKALRSFWYVDVPFLAWALASALAMTLGSEALARGSLGDAMAWAVRSPGVFALNAGLWLGVCLLPAAARSRRARAVSLTALGWLAAAYGEANYYKLRYRMEPLLLSDAAQLGDAMQAVTGLALDIDVLGLALLCAFFVLALGMCAALVKGRRRRAPLLTLAGAALLMALPGLCTFSGAQGTGLYDLAAHARNEGTLYAMLAVENERRAARPDDYSEQAVAEAYASLAQGEAVQDGPNVVVVLSESFVNGDWLGQYVHLTRELTPFFDELCAGCLSGNLYVPKLGGGTSETEFEVLTGVRSAYGVNPYAMGLPPMNSLASILRAQGYEASALHWYYGVYYNRYNNLRMLGFDSFRTLDTVERAFEHVGLYVSDREHYDAILRQMADTPGRDFVFCLTMQNHGGYAYDDFRLSLGADTPFTDELSEETARIVANYCYLLGQSDAALRDFIAALEALDEPVVLAFFGDHIPPLGAEVYEELGVETSGLLGHLTPYFIWSNQGNEPQAQDLYAYELGAATLAQAGLLEDPFLSYVNDLRLASGQSLTGAGRGDSRYDLLCYDALLGEQYAYALAGLSPENPDFQIGGPMELLGFDAAVVGDAVYLRPRLAQSDQAYRLFVNGQAVDTDFVTPDDFPLTVSCVMGTEPFYNQTGEWTFDSAEALLAQSGELAAETTDLAQEEFLLSRKAGGYALYQSARPLAGAIHAVTLDGERLEWQPDYGLSRAGQYSVDGQGHVLLALDTEDLEAYFAQHPALLYDFSPREEAR